MILSFKNKIVIFILMFSMAQFIQAEEKNDKEEKVYSSSTSFSLLTISGNTQELTLGLDTEHNLKLDKNQIQFKGSTIYSKGEEQKISEIYYSHLQYKRSISSRAYLIGFGQWERNVLSGYKYRFAISGGAGYIWTKSERMELSSEITLGLSKENNLKKDKESEPPSSFASSLISSRLKIKISSNSELSLQEIFFINLENTNDSRLSSLGSLSVSINRHVALKISHQLKYNHQPVPGFKSTDQYLLSSLVLNF